MNWFYLSERQEVGPLSVAALEEIHANGCIADETPVRREDSAEWQAYATVFSSQRETHQNPDPPCDRPSYKFHCLHCQQRIVAEEDCSGKTVQCPTCGGDFVVTPLIPKKTLQQPLHVSTSVGKKTKNKTILPMVIITSLLSIGIIAIALSFFNRPSATPKNSYTKSANKSFDPTNPDSVAVVYDAAVCQDKIQERKINDETIYYLPNSDSPYSGWLKEKPDRLSKKTLSHITLGKRDGLLVEFYPSGQICLKSTYKNGIKLGLQEGWYKTGQKEHEIEFDEKGVVTHKKWKPSGELCPETNVVNGNGKAVSYNDDGSPSSISTYKNGKGSVRFLVDPGTAKLFDNFNQILESNNPNLNNSISKKTYFPPSKDDAISLSNCREGDLIRESDQLADTIFLRIYDIGLRHGQVLNYFEKKYYDSNHKVGSDSKSYESRLLYVAKLGAADALKGKDPEKGGIPRFYGIYGSNGEYVRNGKSRLELLENYYGPKEKWQEKHGFSINSKNVDPDDEIEYYAAVTADFLGRFDEAIKSAQQENNDVPHADTTHTDVSHDGMDDITRGLLKAAEKGDGYGSVQYQLALNYHFGKGISKNPEQAAKWFRKAAELGNVEAQFSLAADYIQGKGIKKNYHEAEKWLRKAAVQGHAVSQYHLGTLCWNGSGIEKNQEEALNWFFKAANQNNDRAQAMLGFIYYTGSGIKVDLDQAVSWLKKASDQGNAKAQGLLGACYGDGNGVAKDDITGYMWANLSAMSGAKNGIEVRQALSERMTRQDIETARKKSQEWLDNHKTIIHSESIYKDADDLFVNQNATMDDDEIPQKPTPDMSPRSTLDTLTALEAFNSGTLEEAKECIRQLDEELKKNPDNTRVKLVRTTIMDVFRAESSLTALLEGQKESDKQYQIKMQNLQIASRPSPLTGKVNATEVERIKRELSEIKASSESRINTAKANLRKSLDSAKSSISAPDSETLSRVWSQIEIRNNL